MNTWIFFCLFAGLMHQCTLCECPTVSVEKEQSDCWTQRCHKKQRQIKALLQSLFSHLSDAVLLSAHQSVTSETAEVMWSQQTGMSKNCNYICLDIRLLLQKKKKRLRHLGTLCLYNKMRWKSWKFAECK